MIVGRWHGCRFDVRDFGCMAVVTKRRGLGANSVRRMIAGSLRLRQRFRASARINEAVRVLLAASGQPRKRKVRRPNRGITLWSQRNEE